MRAAVLSKVSAGIRRVDESPVCATSAIALWLLGCACIIAVLITLTQDAVAVAQTAGKGHKANPSALPTVSVPASPTSPDCAPDWTVVSSPYSAAGNELNAVAAISPTDVWGVGDYFNRTVNQTLILHWNGTAWSVVPSPNSGTNGNSLAGVAAVSATDIWAVGYYFDGDLNRTLILHWDGNAWSTVPSPNPGLSGNSLRGLAAVSADDVWAVGDYFYAALNQTLIMHWNGSIWSMVPSPNLGTGFNTLDGVAAISANDVWAVGYYSDGGSRYRTLIVHWDGSIWSTMSSPNTGTGANYLYGIAAVSTNDVWAVGLYSNGGIWQTLTLHWDGSAWSVVSSPNPSTSVSELHSIAAISANDVWAVGDYYNGSTYLTLTLHWDGSTWSIVFSPNAGTPNYLNAVAIVSAGDVWAVGHGNTDNGNTNQTVALHWDGSLWSVVPSPNTGSTTTSLNGITAISSNDAWAVGYYGGYGNTSGTLVEHWDGTGWWPAYSPNPDPLPRYLFGVTAVSADDVWAVGYYGSYGSERTLVEHWDGLGWTIVSSPNQSASDNRLNAVTAVSSDDVWAVGNYHNAGGVYQTLILHWDGSAWSVLPSPDLSTGDNLLYGIAAASANDAWGVGFYATNIGYQTLILHWNGGTWEVTPSPSPSASYNRLWAVAIASANDIWAVGDYATGSYIGQTLTLHWDGSTWSIVPSPDQGTSHNEVLGVTVAQASDVWAVGYYRSGSVHQTLVLHWNGSAWSIVPSPNPGTGYNELWAADALSAGDVWAVGTGGGQMLTERYNPCPTTCPIRFADLPNPSTYYQYVECLACRDVISGYPCGGAGEPCNPAHDPYFRPNARVTRGQIAKMVALSAQITNAVSGQSFEDMPPGSTFYTYTEQLHARGVMNGYPCGGASEPCRPPNNRPYFRPGSAATRGQLAKIDANTAGYYDPPRGQQFEDVSVGSAFYTYTARLVSRGVMSGYPCGGPGEPCVPPGNLPYFRPNNSATRGQITKIVSNTFFPDCNPRE